MANKNDVPVNKITVPVSTNTLYSFIFRIKEANLKYEMNIVYPIAKRMTIFT